VKWQFLAELKLCVSLPRFYERIEKEVKMPKGKEELTKDDKEFIKSIKESNLDNNQKNRLISLVDINRYVTSKIIDILSCDLKCQRKKNKPNKEVR
jgi:hypothetical protein